MDGKRAEQKFMNNLATQSLRDKYMDKAQDIGSNAITLVNEYFDVSGGIEDKVNGDYHQWTLTDLDRALDEMRKLK